METNTLICYATNSGGTLTASEVVQKSLQDRGLNVGRKDIRDVKPETLGEYELIVFGSPSWDYNKSEGMPHEFFSAFMERVNKNISLKMAAVFGLGDSAYINFCGAVDHIEKFINANNGVILTPSLRIDGFFFHQTENEQILREWSESLANTFKLNPVTQNLASEA